MITAILIFRFQEHFLKKNIPVPFLGGTGAMPTLQKKQPLQDLGIPKIIQRSGDARTGTQFFSAFP